MSDPVEMLRCCGVVVLCGLVMLWCGEARGLCRSGVVWWCRGVVMC